MNSFKRVTCSMLLYVIVGCWSTWAFSQPSSWKIVPRNNFMDGLDREAANNFEHYTLLTDVFLAIDLLESKSRDAGASFLSNSEQAALHAIKMEFDRPLFLQVEAMQKGVELDLDVIFNMRARRAEEVLQLTSDILQDKIHAVIQVVNRRRLGDWFGNIPAITGERIADLLKLSSEQREALAKLADQHQAKKSDASQRLAKRLRELRDEYRTKMTFALDAEGRRWFNSTFGEPIDLLDENGKSVFFELVEAYDLAPANHVLETVRSFVAETVDPRQSEDNQDDPSARGNASGTINIDAVEYALIRSDLIQQELGLSESQKKAIRDSINGKCVNLTNESRNSRLMKLIAGEAIERSELFKSLSSNQGNRLNQIEIQIRTSGNLDSFGILDDLVALHLKLDAGVRREIAQLAKDYKAAVAELFEDHRVESQQLMVDYQRQALAVLTDDQKREFESYFGASEVR